MLPAARKLRCSFALSPELIQALNDYSASFEVDRDRCLLKRLYGFTGRHLDRHLESDAKKQFQHEEALAA